VTECVILFRYDNGRVDFVHEGDDDPPRMAIYPNRDTAIESALNTVPICRVVPYQVVELEDL
jgi:hypothetical protein